jgi:glycogen synthase
MQNAMAGDFSWDEPVREYVEVYERVSAARAAGV